MTPTPLPLGGTADIDGAGFLPGETTVTVAGVPQATVFVQPEKVRFDVSLATPLGAAALAVTTPEGQATTAIEVVPGPPALLALVDEPVVLGVPATVGGDDLDTVTAVTLDGLPCDITAQSPTQLAFTAPLDPTLIGTATLLAQSPWGSDTLSVPVAPPTPVIDVLSPNPVRQGDLLTAQGTVLPWSLSASVGGLDAVLLSAEAGALTLEVPRDLPAGPTEVVVLIGAVASAPAGPLVVQEADPDRPDVDAVVPGVLAVGGDAWLVGDDLDQLDWTTPGVEVHDCDDKACRLTVLDPTAGPLVAAVGGPAGTAVFELQIEDPGETPPIPVITGTEPNPALRGQTLSVFGTDLHEVHTVVLGGRLHTPEFVDVDEVRITVAEDTSLGAERLFVAGAGGSNALLVTVLDPLPEPEPEPDVAEPADTSPDASDAGGAANDTAAPGPTEDAAAQDVDDTDTVVPGPGGSGCVAGQTGRRGWAWAWCLALVALMCTRRRRAWC